MDRNPVDIAVFKYFLASSSFNMSVFRSPRKITLRSVLACNTESRFVMALSTEYPQSLYRRSNDTKFSGRSFAVLLTICILIVILTHPHLIFLSPRIEQLLNFLLRTGLLFPIYDHQFASVYMIQLEGRIVSPANSGTPSIITLFLLEYWPCCSKAALVA